MASGDPVLTILDVWPPSTLFAVLGRRAGGSTPNEGVNVWQFDAATIWYLDFLCVLQGYGGGGLTLTIPWTAATATTGVTRWGIAVRRMTSTEDIDVSKTYSFTDVDATAPSTSGVVLLTTLALTSGAAMDNWANNELAIVRLRRNASHANDTQAGNSEVHGSIYGRET
jgi:hypothetical protein